MILTHVLLILVISVAFGCFLGNALHPGVRWPQIQFNIILESFAM